MGRIDLFFVKIYKREKFREVENLFYFNREDKFCDCKGVWISAGGLFLRLRGYRI